MVIRAGKGALGRRHFNKLFFTLRSRDAVPSRAIRLAANGCSQDFQRDGSFRTAIVFGDHLFQLLRPMIYPDGRERDQPARIGEVRFEFPQAALKVPHCYVPRGRCRAPAEAVTGKWASASKKAMKMLRSAQVENLRSGRDGAVCARGSRNRRRLMWFEYRLGAVLVVALSCVPQARADEMTGSPGLT